MKTGQSTTSFHPATGNPIMTSTTYNRSVEPVTEENKTGCCNESNGGTLGLIRGRGKTVGYALRAINDLLPLAIRPIKPRHRGYGYRTRVGVLMLQFRINWKYHYKPRVKEMLGINK